MLRRKAVIIGGLKIQYYQSDSFDDKNALVFLHGWGSRAAIFGNVLEKCENAIALDLPGFGNSEAPKETWSLTDYAIFLDAFIRRLNIENPIVVGHSFGGSIAIKYCASGKNVKKLILIGSAGIRKKTARKYGLLVIAKIFGFVFSLPGIGALKNTARKWFYEKIDLEDYINAGSLVKIYKEVISDDLRDDLEKIAVETVLIWGGNDVETPVEDGKLMQKLIKGAKLYTISNAGHYAFLDNEKEFEKIFLSQII